MKYVNPLNLIGYKGEAKRERHPNIFQGDSRGVHPQGDFIEEEYLSIGDFHPRSEVTPKVTSCLRHNF